MLNLATSSPASAALNLFIALLMMHCFSPSSLLGQQEQFNEVTGAYRRLPIENDWHEGEISVAMIRGKKMLQWRNQAGVSWTLTPDFKNGVLKTDESCPYFASGQTEFTLQKRDSKIIGFRFNNDTFVRNGVEIIPQRSGGFHGYISMQTQRPPDGYGYGVSFYVSIWPLIEKPMSGFQIGLPSTWIIPDNRDFNEPLCPPGTVARDNWPERGPHYRDVFQTIEGGLGYWVSTRFPSTNPKYRMNGTPNGYNHEISSPGWGFGKTKSLPPKKLGIAQLSNRLVVPPDGMTFEAEASGKILGNAWMVLDLAPEDNQGDKTPTGNNCWTLFLNTDNFKGPVAFWIPETWSQLSRRYPTINGRGLDARPGLMGSGAMEVNTVPYFESTSKDGTGFSRIPPIQFPVDGRGETILMQDVLFYQRNALTKSGRFDAKKAWQPKLTANPIAFDQGSKRTKLDEIDKTVQTKIFDLRGSQAFGLQWRPTRERTSYRRLPEYFQSLGKKRIVVEKSNVPEDTKLSEQAFAGAQTTQPYQSPTSGIWINPGPKSKPAQIKLTDGSVVTYAWFRFVDQPSIQALDWSDEKKANVQLRVEAIHAQYSIDKNYLPAPTKGKLVAMDDVMIVEPPKGMEVGYVPIVTRQEMPKGK
ncbi:MAG: hypothetical protein AAFN77_08550 [Planctomycetota bacterium]